MDKNNSGAKKRAGENGSQAVGLNRELAVCAWLDFRIAMS